MEYVTLNNGIKMPMAGIGTFLLSPDEAENSVLSALKEGYRLIDTANAYMNEKAVGRAIKKSVCQKKISYLHWRQYKHPSRCTSLYTMMAATHSMCSTRSVTKRTAKKTGSAGFLLKKQLKNSPHARKEL